MRKIPITYLLFILLGCSQSQVPEILREDYSFLLTNGEITKLRQSNDTLNEYRCLIGQDCSYKYETHYRIITSKKENKFTILRLEWLDTIPRKDELCPGKRFSIMVFKNLDKNQFGYALPISCLTRKQMDTTQINNFPFNDRTLVTYFSDSYLKQLSSFKKVTSISDVKQIMNAIESNNFDAGQISYSAEQLNRACIENGFNPVGAGIVIDSLLK